MTPVEWLIEADQRIASARGEIEYARTVSSCEAFWPNVRDAANYAEQTIKFLETGKQLIQGAVSMTACLDSVIATKFGKYVPCDKETYRKLKALRVMADKADVWARRWNKSLIRKPRNRTYKRSRADRPLFHEELIFQPFYQLVPDRGW